MDNLGLIKLSLKMELEWRLLDDAGTMLSCVLASQEVCGEHQQPQLKNLNQDFQFSLFNRTSSL